MSNFESLLIPRRKLTQDRILKLEKMSLTRLHNLRQNLFARCAGLHIDSPIYQDYLCVNEYFGQRVENFLINDTGLYNIHAIDCEEMYFWAVEQKKDSTFPAHYQHYLDEVIIACQDHTLYNYILLL